MDKENKTQSRIVETYAEDMAKVIEDDKSGLIKKIIHGEEEHEMEKMNLSPESRKNKFFMFVSLLFVGLGFFVLFYFFIKKEVPTVPVEQQFAPLIFNDKNNFIEVRDLKREEIARTVYNSSQATKVKSGGIEGIYLTYDKKVVGLREFIALIKGNFVPGDNALFVSNSFLMGVVNKDTKDFFILLKARSIPDIFDSLHTWEGKMFSDLHGFFGIDITSETSRLLTTDFEDGIIQNKNARILYRKNDKQEKEIVMMYVLADNNSVIIANTENAVREIMLRLAGSQIEK